MSAGHSKKTYLVMFIVLTVLTGLEVGVKYLGLPRGVMIGALISLALGKATLVALFFMHLKSETRTLKMVVGLPMCFPALYAVVLIIESIARSAFT